MPLGGKRELRVGDAFPTVFAATPFDWAPSAPVMSTDRCYIDVTCVCRKRGDTVYCVELDEGQKVSVPRSSIFMTEDQAKTVKEEIAVASPMKTTPQRITDVSLGESM